MDLNDIHKRFFSFRNGIVAKAFHDAGYPHPRIFGLQLPQIAQIARETGLDSRLGFALWEEENCRESRLLACYLIDPETLPENKALEMAAGVATREEADILAWRLLRRLPYAHSLLPKLNGYVQEALERNLGN